MALRRASKRRPLSMTSLIDVIFLLLLFFMLSSTFSRFAEVEIAAAASGRSAEPSDNRPTFLRLSEEEVSLNGQTYELAQLPEAFAELRQDEDDALPVLISLQDAVSSQRLTDLLVALRPVQGLSVTVLDS
ncbi:MAG: biopolymer transporter ExbD [Pseudomonadota bacterium]